MRIRYSDLYQHHLFSARLLFAIFITQILISIMSSLIFQVESKTFSSINAARTFFTTLNLEKKYSTQKQIIDQLNSLHQNVRDALMNFFDYVIRDRF
jgi:hypothetical protein